MSQWDSLIASAGQKYNVDPQLIASIVKTESSGNPNAYNAEYGATGLGQQIPATAKALGIDPRDPAQSIEGVAKLLNENLNRYGSPEQAVLAYHGGTDQANWGPKTQDYLRKVSANYGAPIVVKQTAQPAGPDAFEEMFGPRPDAASPTAQEAPAADPFEAMFGPRPTSPEVRREPAIQAPGTLDNMPQPAAPPASLPSQAADLIQMFGAQGIKNANAIGRGISDVFDAPSEWLASGAEASGLTGALAKAGINMPTAEQQKQLNIQSRAEYDARNPEPGIQGTLSRVGGNVIGTAGPISKAGEAISMGGNALLNAMRGSPSLSGAVPAAQAVGNFVAGNGGLLSRMTNLGTQGAAGAALLSGASDTPLLEQMGTGFALGAAVPAVAGVVKSGANTVKSLVQPFYEKGQTAVAQKTLQRLAGKGPVTPDLTEYVPGSSPTLAQATKNPMLAALERSSESSAPLEFGAVKEANNIARVAHLDNVRGDASTLAAAIDARETQALPLLAKAMQGSKPTDPKPVVQVINDILESPEGKRGSVVSAMNNVLDKLKNKSGQLETDPAQLYGVRKSINDQLEKVAGRDNSEAQQASSQLLQVKQALDDAIESGAPGFRQYLKDYADLSKPVNAQSYLQNRKFFDASGERVTLPRVSAELDRIEKLRKASGANDAKAITDDQLEALRNLKKDLVRESYSSTLGKSAGSNTKQNLAMDNLMQSLLPGPLGKLPLGPEVLGGGIGGLVAGPAGAGYGAAAGNALRQGMAAQNPEIQGRLIELLLNPKTVLAAPQGAAGNLLLQRGAALGVPAISREGGAKNR